MIGVILAAGNGVRLKISTGEDCCKVLKEINGIHLIEFALNNLVKLNVDKVCIVIGKQGDLIKAAIGDEYKGITVSYTHQAQQKGLINAFVQGLNAIHGSDDVVLQLADEILVDLKSDEIKYAITDMSSSFYCGVTYEDDHQKIMNNFSVEADENMILKSCIEKPVQIINNIKGTGFCIFDKECVQMLKDTYNEITNIPNDLCDYMNGLVAAGKKGTVLFVAEREFNINTATDLREAIGFLDENIINICN